MSKRPPGKVLSLTVLVCCGALGLASFTPATSTELRRTPIVKAVEKARPSVVNIHGEKILTPNDARLAGADAGRRVNGMGTGVVIDERGYILTNFHVVEGVKKIMVTLSDERAFVASNVARDPKTDLAIIKIDVGESLPVIQLGTSSDLMPGESVVAMGNAFGYENTVTWGIVSALHRTVQVSDAQSYEDLIQTDASINPGNSGGPLLNIDGEMIGLNVAVRAGAQGIGFAIPIDKAMNTAAELLNVRKLNHVWHGLVAEPKYSASGVELVVDSVEPNSPAATAGVEPGDVIRNVGDQQISRMIDVERALLSRKAGDDVNVSLERGKESIKVALALTEARDGGEVAAEDKTWDLLGLKLEKLSAKQFSKYRTNYHGGLMVTDVRPSSPAAKQGIARGDVLVGMHVWETVSLDNVNYILGRQDFAEFSPIKFYILRGNETLFGHLSVARREQH